MRPVHLPRLRGNPASQGYRLSDAELRSLRFAVRFPTGVCLSLVVTALVLESPAVLLALAALAAVAGFTPRHPFDLVWNIGDRRLGRGAAQLPPNPRPRRHAFKLGCAWLLAVAALFAAGLTAPALALGAMLVAACASATVLNFCVPSEALALLEARRRPRAASCVTCSAFEDTRKARKSGTMGSTIRAAKRSET